MVLPDRFRVKVISFTPFTGSPSVSPSKFSWNSCISFQNIMSLYFTVYKETTLYNSKYTMYLFLYKIERGGGYTVY